MGYTDDERDAVMPILSRLKATLSGLKSGQDRPSPRRGGAQKRAYRVQVP